MKVTKSIPVVYALSIVIVAGVFILDLLTPLDYAVWLGYLLPLIIASWKLQRWFVYALAAVCTAFIVLGFIYTPSGIKSEMAIFNRFLGVSMLWVTTIFIVKLKQAVEALHESEARYRSLV